MRFYILKTADVPDLVDGITMEENYGHITVITNRGLISGEHIAVSGDVEAIKAWLGPMKDFWKGVGQPMLQEFEVCHIDMDEQQGASGEEGD